MELLRASELADRLSLSRGRISQLVSEGKFDGCYQGNGRNRRFDLAKCVSSLDRTLDFGQMHGNGAEAAATRREVLRETENASGLPAGASQLPDSDTDAMRLVKLEKEKEGLRKLKRENLAYEQAYALRSEVDTQVRRMLQQEIMQIETMLCHAAQRIADELAVDMKTVRSILMQTWRKQREERAQVLDGAADQAELTDAECEADI
ncbi:hypothetical protein AAD018_011460 [Aestuariibius insulae]|uniref:hypothetical protein n=1 Tax=Aestuariibius insulae TaxID=2058287 RepID=UPI00345E7457